MLLKLCVKFKGYGSLLASFKVSAAKRKFLGPPMSVRFVWPLISRLVHLSVLENIIPTKWCFEYVENVTIPNE